MNNDEHEGQGGSYELRDGVRVLVARTDHIADIPQSPIPTPQSNDPQPATRNPKSINKGDA